MSNDIAIIDEPGVAKDVTDEVTLLALNPADMKVSQAKLAKWFETKRQIMVGDAEDLEAAAIAAVETGFSRLKTIEKQANIARKRADFYEKCKVAIEAGYCIVPNFPVQAFAIRTTKRSPKDGDTHAWEGSSHEQESNAPKLGAGSYVDSLPKVGKYSQQETNAKGVLETKNFTYASGFKDEIDFPISVAKPAIMSATQRAMAVKCFDEIGVLPNRHVTKRDPIVVGSIIRPGPKQGYWFHGRWINEHRRLMFLIGWSVNFEDL